MSVSQRMEERTRMAHIAAALKIDTSGWAEPQWGIFFSFISLPFADSAALTSDRTALRTWVIGQLPNRDLGAWDDLTSVAARLEAIRDFRNSPKFADFAHCYKRIKGAIKMLEKSLWTDSK